MAMKKKKGEKKPPKSLRVVSNLGELKLKNQFRAVVDEFAKPLPILWIENEKREKKETKAE